MRLLLIQAVSIQDGKEVVFPLGLARLAAALDGRHEVRGLDLNRYPFPWPKLIETLDQFKPQAVALSFRNLDPLAGSLVSFVPQLKSLASFIREYSPESTLMLGGSGFSLFPARLMKEVPEVHIGFCGEADAGFPKLLENLQSPWKVPGTLWRRGEEIVGTSGISTCDTQLDELPLPDWELFDPGLYQDLNQYVAFMGVETKRGCPNRCRYCLYPSLQGNRLRLRSPELVVDEMETLQNKFRIKLVHFTDPVVNQPASHLRAICSEILNRRLNIGWTGFFREDCLSLKDLELYRKAGLATCYFSGDGTSDWALELLGKGLGLNELLGAARTAAASGVLTVYHFLVNLPGETQRTVDSARALLDSLFEIHARGGKLGAVVLNNLRLYPGASLTEEIIRARLIDRGQDLLYPVYFNPPPWDSLRHELTARCMKQSASCFLAQQVKSAVISGTEDRRCE